METGKRTKAESGDRVQQDQQKIGGKFVANKNPEYIQHRLDLIKVAVDRQTELYKGMEQREIQITVKYRDNKVKLIQGKAFKTTALDAVKKANKKWLKTACISRVTYSQRDEFALSFDIEGDVGKMCSGKEFVNTGELWDLNRQLEGDCTVEVFDFDTDEGKEVFWHSAAHILGEALEGEYGCHLCFGPPLEHGFFYDSYVGDLSISKDDFKQIDKAAKSISKKSAKFQRVMLTKKEALEVFKHNPFKTQLITTKVADNGMCSLYQSGDFIDLCTGPHVPNTGFVKSFQCTKVGSSYWLGKNTNDSLQRVYGMAFPNGKMLIEYNKKQKLLKERDHRHIGPQQDLFLFHQLSPGSCFFQPKGAMIYNKLVALMRKQYIAYGFQEVISPNIFNLDLWWISGHALKYQDNMFMIDIENQKFGVKPMNCPGHCLMFDSQTRSYKDLPIRMADFGVLHRNELSGALSGLTRVRRFQQDDAHIFCRVDQIEEEILSNLEFLKYVYSLIGFEFKLELSTRPENFLGEIATWDSAEQQLTNVLNKFGMPWKENPQDGAFYGPKIDIQLFDSIGRAHQCGTIQLDFVLPSRFGLKYRTNEKVEHQKVSKEDQQKEEAEQNEMLFKVKESKDPGAYLAEKVYHVGMRRLKPGYERPVIVHRAILGSVERMFAILCEHTGGKWPFWLSPRQVQIIPITDAHLDFANSVNSRFVHEGFSCEINTNNDSLPKKIKEALNMEVNYMCIIGDKEVAAGKVDVRARDGASKEDKQLGQFTVNEFVEFLRLQAPPLSGAEQRLLKKSFFNKQDNTHEKFDKTLSEQPYLEGDGLEVGPADWQVYESLCCTPVDQVKYPNLVRWKKIMDKQAAKKCSKEVEQKQEA